MCDAIYRVFCELNLVLFVSLQVVEIEELFQNQIIIKLFEEVRHSMKIGKNIYNKSTETSNSFVMSHILISSCMTSLYALNS